MKIALLAITEGGKRLARQLAAGLPGAVPVPDEGPIGVRLARHWRDFDGFVCIMAAGIVVRAVAPLLEDKRYDPCVVVVDEAGRYAVSLLSGHLGGGNELARQVAARTGGSPVITTASDVLGLPALDLWARDLGLQVDDPKTMTEASSLLVSHGRLRVYTEAGLGPLPTGLEPTAAAGEAELVVSDRSGWPAGTLVFRPPTLVVGVGCRRGVQSSDLEAAFGELLEEAGLARLSVRGLASIDLKADEAGLLAFATENRWPLLLYTKDQLNQVPGVMASAAARKATGARAVAEPAALLAAGTDTLLVEKRKWKNLTLALARARSLWSAPAPAASTT